jgi:uncharacterized protein YbjT (DUF2867 family)
MILITGATGTNGSEIVKLLSRSGVPCRAMARTLPKSDAARALPGVEFVCGDFTDPATLAPVLEGVETALLISSIDPRLPELQGNFVAAARREGVRRVVKFSGLGADPASPWRFARWHGDAEKRLEDSGLAFTHLRPNQFMQVYLRFAPTIAAQGKFFAASRDARVSPVDARDIAAVALAVLTRPGHLDRRYEITGPEALTYSEIADRLSMALGRPVTYVDVPLAVARQAVLDSGMPEWFADGQAEQFRLRWAGGQSAVTTVIRDIARRPPTTFAEFARDHAAAFRAPP